MTTHPNPTCSAPVNKESPNIPIQQPLPPSVQPCVEGLIRHPTRKGPTLYSTGTIPQHRSPLTIKDDICAPSDIGIAMPCAVRNVHAFLRQQVIPLHHDVGWLLPSQFHHTLLTLPQEHPTRHFNKLRMHPIVTYILRICKPHLQSAHA
jgi:hypothetical protein